MMDILVTIVVGGVVGWLASLIIKSDAQMGLLANIIVGIIGSVLGFWLAGLLGLAASGVIVRWIVAIVGAVILIFILRALKILK